MTAEILSLHPGQGDQPSRPSLSFSARSMGGLWRVIRRIVEAVGWLTIFGLIAGHM